jgi:uncharacterized phiE125 gp8 family phage protein
MKVKLYTAPAIEPVGVPDLMLHLRIDDETAVEGDYLESLVRAARERVEEITGRQILTATWEYFLDEWPRGNAIKLPFGNLQNAAGTAPVVTWKDDDGTVTTLTVATDYLVETNGPACGRIVLPYAGTWPTGTLYPSNPITVRFVCGWTAANLVPHKIRAAIKMIAADLYEQRGEPVVGQSVIKNRAVEWLLASHTLRDEF